jgi:hypothetical protein
MNVQFAHYPPAQSDRLSGILGKLNNHLLLVFGLILLLMLLLSIACDHFLGIPVAVD